MPEVHPLAQVAGRDGWRLTLPHSVGYARLIWLTRGHGQVMLDGLQHAASPNTAVFVPADTLCALTIAGPLFGTLMSIPPEAEIPLPTGAHRLRIPAAQGQAELVGIFDAVTKEQQGRRDFHGQAIRAQAMLFSVWLRRAVLATPSPPPLRADQRLTVGFARALVRDYRSGQPMAAYASHLGVTPSHLTRACKRASGQSASALLTGRVLHAARSLLADTTHKSGQIANHLGFRSASHFTRFIQNQTGATPTKLRARTPRPPRPAA